MPQSVASTKYKDFTTDTMKVKQYAVFQMLKMLGNGYFLITLIGILSFSLLFFILWFM